MSSSITFIKLHSKNSHPTALTKCSAKITILFLLATLIPGISVPKPCNQGTLPGRCVASQKQQTSPEMLIYMFF